MFIRIVMALALSATSLAAQGTGTVSGTVVEILLFRRIPPVLLVSCKIWGAVDA